MENRRNTPIRFGKIIKIRLVEKEMTQRELAERVGTSQKYLSQIIHGHKAGHKYIGAISEILEIPLADSF